MEIADFDYSTLKLFFLTLLWRAGVTKRDMFRKVQLGPHEHRLRRMILAGDPGDQHDYAVAVGIHQDTPSYGLPMLSPVPFKEDDTGINYYRFSLGHLNACIKVDGRPSDPTWNGFLISPNAPLRFVILDELKVTPLYKSLASAMRQRYGRL